LQARKDSSLIYEPPTPSERTWIKQGLLHFMPVKEVTQFLEGKHLLVGRGRRLEVYLLSRTLLKLYQKISSHYHPYFVGLYLGDIKNEIFEPSLHILQHLTAKVKEEAVVKVTTEGEQRFLYGHNLFPKHLHESSSVTQTEERTIITNQHGEGLGYCVIMRKRTQTPILKNRKDLGWYLRRGQ
jgi:ribosome biogenesis protein Nip4